jgi:hypothetical protein
LGFGSAFKNPKTLTHGGIAWLRPTGTVLLIPYYTQGRGEPIARVFAGYRVKLEKAP